MKNIEMITISKDEYKELLKRNEFLNCLVACGWIIGRDMEMPMKR